jgi:hypothetical protein
MVLMGRVKSREGLERIILINLSIVGKKTNPTV